MKQVTRIMTDHCQADATMTYSLTSADGENIHWYQHNSSSGISIFLENTSYFIPIQWHSKLSILDTEQQIYINILPPYRPRKGDDQSYSGQSKVIKLKYIPWSRSQNFQQFNTYLDKRCGCFCTSTSKKLKCITHRVLAREGLSFELSCVILQG